MSRPKPAQPEVLRDLISRVDTLLKLGVVTKDFVINSLEASVITGLSEETIRRYARYRYIPCIQYPGRNMYPLKGICKLVEDRYREVTVVSTSEMKGYKGVKMGRPKKSDVKGFAGRKNKGPEGKGA
jgi:hypothetical protein